MSADSTSDPDPADNSPTPERQPSEPRRPSTRPPSKTDLLRYLRQLTLRDHQLLEWLAEHYLLSTAQIATALFPSQRSALLRLATLHRIGAVHRFVDIRAGTGQHLYTLGPLGLVVHPHPYSDPTRPDARPTRTSIERAHRIIGSTGRRSARLLARPEEQRITAALRVDTGLSRRVSRWQ
ncbi:replication-relaxation family protein [Micromonospora globbae]|uniref:replication-relaxation family protein n=1 Tax=Micromonospora globbae TaxID=1894969 RepID=UPI00344233D3